MGDYIKKIKETYAFWENEQARKEYNNEVVKKTWEYQKQYGFETNPRQGHEFWNVEADAFKHTFSSAEIALKYGNMASVFGGIDHENKTPNNPQGEWNMDSWNNNQGREIAKEIQKEYGKNFENFSQKQKDDIIAAKVMERMRNGKLITHPDDKRVYKGIPEKMINKYVKSREGQTTGQASNLKNSNHIYTRDEIGKMSTDEYLKNEKAILKQMKEKGIPAKRELEKSRQRTSGTGSQNSSTDGHWITINGNHVLIDD